MKVDAREIVFIKENAPKAFPRLIIESLEAKGVSKLNRTAVHTEISTLKDTYNPVIIEEARRLLYLIKGVKYSKNSFAQ
jgi:hypothetical protein